MREMGWGDFVVAVLAGFLGGFTFLAFSDFQLLRADWCGPEINDCFREWVGALSGWAAALAAALTIFVLMRQLDAARSSTEIAQQALEAARHSSERQLRAYLSTEKPRVENFETADRQLSVTIKNAGQTPAYDVSVGIGWLLDDKDEMEPQSVVPVTPFGVIGPGQLITVNHPLPIPAERVREMTNRVATGDCTIWFLGTVLYKDAFDRQRVTRFKVERTGIDGSSEVRMKNSLSGNDAT